MDKPTPRINSALREQYVERTVRLSGKIVTVQYSNTNTKKERKKGLTVGAG